MNPAKLAYTLKAEEDLESITEYIANDNITNALAFIAKIKSAIETLTTSPYIGVHCKTKGIARDCRIYVFGSYLIFYHYNEMDNAVTILRIIHGARKYKILLNNDKDDF